MTLNPYAKFLGEGDAVAVIAATPERLVTFLSGLTAEQENAPIAAGKWSPREIVAHLADCEIAFAFRLRQTLAGVALQQPFDQDDWAATYGRTTLAAALDCFKALRAWNVGLASGLSDGDKRRITTHPERGEMTLWTIIETMAGHDLNHLEKLEASRS